MIKNEREYHITKTQAEKFKASIETAESAKAPPGVHPKLHRASIDAMKGQRATLLEELAAYDTLQASGGKQFSGEYRDLATMLIQARIARGWSQRQLAERLGLHMQKVQQYEATEYAGASLTRIGEVAAALGLRLGLAGELVDLKDSAPSAPPKNAPTRRGKTSTSSTAAAKPRSERAIRLRE